MAKSTILLPEESKAIERSIELLNLLLELQSKLIAVKKKMEARNNG